MITYTQSYTKRGGKGNVIMSSLERAWGNAPLRWHFSYVQQHQAMSMLI